MQLNPTSQQLRLVLLMALSLTLWSCATPSDIREDYVLPGTTGMRVDRLEIRGVEQFRTRDIKAGLATQEDPGWRTSRPWRWLPFLGAEEQYFNHFDWQRDRERILAFYKERGFFNAEIVSESILESSEGDAVRVTITIEEGAPTRVTEIAFLGLDLIVSPTPEELLSGQPLRVGDVFTQAGYLRTREAVRNRLENAGYAYAQVGGRAVIEPEILAAEVTFYVDPGPQTVFGRIHILGLEDVEEGYVQNAIPFRRGNDYSPNALFHAQQDIYDLGVFSLVTVLPAHEARDFVPEDSTEHAEITKIVEEEAPAAAEIEELPETPKGFAERLAAERLAAERAARGELDQKGEPGALGISGFLDAAQRSAEARSQLPEEVPVVVRLKEAKKYSIRVGAGVAAEGTRQDVHALANWSARNFLGGLRRLEHFNSIGYAWSPGIIGLDDIGNEGVILTSELRFAQPQFFERLTSLRLRARVERDVREGFTVWHPSLRVGVSRPFFRHLTLEAAYNVSYFNFSNVDEGLIDVTATALGLDFQPEFMLEYFEQTALLDYRDDPLNPMRGFLVRAGIQEAGRYIAGGTFDYIKPNAAAELYIPMRLHAPAVLALRTRLSSAYNIGRDTGVPIQERLYAGGKDSMRSFGSRRLSLYAPTGEPVPLGGLTLFETAVEPRLRLVPRMFDVGDLWGAIFFDAATVLRGQFLFDTDVNLQGTETWGDLTSTLVYGMGAGLWWITPIGPVRFDFAYTLSDISTDLRFRRCTNPEAAGTEECIFVPVEDDPIQQLISGYGFYISIGHSF